MPSAEQQSSSEVTLLLRKVQSGDKRARDELFETLQGELRAMARNFMQRERVDHTLQTTALLNEAFLRLANQNEFDNAESRRHFFAAAHRAMRQILVDHARARNAEKRGGNRKRVPMDDVLDTFEQRNGVDCEQLDAALERLAAHSQRQRDVVEFRIFAGMSIEETANILGVGTATVERDWRIARARLYSELSNDR